jgi:ankyrin repeat protein
MGRGGRPRKHDPIADTIQREIRAGRIDLAKSLITEAGTDVLDGEARTPLIYSAAGNHIDLLPWLIAQGGNVNHQDRTGYCALHFAAQNRLLEVAATLLNAGAVTELRDIHGNTPLWTAAFNARGNFEVFRLLLAHGASLENRNLVDKTPREVAMKFFPDDLPREIELARAMAEQS